MFEFDKYEKGRHKVPLAVPAGQLLPPLKIDGAAFLLWSEHCIECAAPDCFKTCDLYVRRPDGRCRRFQYGMSPNSNFPGGRSMAAEVVFGRWAKIEARGNARILRKHGLRLAERAAPVLSRTLDSLGKMVAPVLRDLRWNYLAFALFERLNSAVRKMGVKELPDGFLIDIYNPTQQSVVFSFSMSVSIPQLLRHLGPESVPRPFQKRITIAPGQHRELIPFTQFRDIIESGLPFNMALTPQGADGHHVVFIQLDLVKLAMEERKKLEAPSKGTRSKIVHRVAAKCVVFDLDNTLWEGVLLESDDVRLRPVVRKLLRTLDERGILLSIASKNVHDHAMSKLREFGIEEYFLYPKINWGPKSETLKQVAKNLDIGIDTFVFVDDNPFELEEVASALEAVECVDASRIGDLLSHPRLQGSTSAEARTRRRMYREAMVRAEAQSMFGADYIAFLRTSDIRLTIRPDRPDDLERIVELVQRTNQLNFSGHKYSREEILRLFEDPAIERHVLACADKYGDYGTVGFCMARRNEATVRVEDFMLSCRVQGKFVESALFDHLCSRSDPPANRIEVNFRKTDRNVPAQQVLEKLGFDINSPAPLCRDVAGGTFAVDFIRFA